MTVTGGCKALRAALYLRVSTMRQAENDVSIPDQRRQGEAWCASHGYELVETFVDAGVSATSDRRPESQRLVEAASEHPARQVRLRWPEFCTRWENDAFGVKYRLVFIGGYAKSGGEGGIRTPDTLASMPHFECGAFDHSATSPSL